jgi:hypothetical protein
MTGWTMREATARLGYEKTGEASSAVAGIVIYSLGDYLRAHA